MCLDKQVHKWTNEDALKFLIDNIHPIHWQYDYNDLKAFVVKDNDTILINGEEFKRGQSLVADSPFFTDYDIKDAAEPVENKQLFLSGKLLPSSELVMPITFTPFNYDALSGEYRCVIHESNTFVTVKPEKPLTQYTPYYTTQYSENDDVIYPEWVVDASAFKYVSRSVSLIKTSINSFMKIIDEDFLHKFIKFMHNETNRRTGVQISNDPLDNGLQFVIDKIKQIDPMEEQNETRV